MISGIVISEGMAINSDIVNARIEISGSGSDSPRSASLRKDTHQRFRVQSLSLELKIHNSLLLRLLLFASSLLPRCYVARHPCTPPPSIPLFSLRWLNTLPCRVTFASHLFRFYVALCKLECKYVGFSF